MIPSYLEHTFLSPFLKIGTPTLMCQSRGTHSSSLSNIVEVCQRRQSYNIENFQELRMNLIHHKGPATKELFKCFSDLTPSDGLIIPLILRFCFLVSVGLRRGSKCFFRCSTISSVEVSRAPS